MKKDEAKKIRSITEWGAIEKSPILLLQYCKKRKLTVLYFFGSYFGETNNIFVVCTD